MFICVYLCSILLFLSACRQEDETWAHIQETGVLRVGLDPTYPPFENADAPDLQGIDIDLAHALANELGVQVEFVLFGYDGLYDALATNQVDVLLSALVIVPERMRDFAYSEPYFNAGEVLIVRENEANIREMADMNGRSLAVELGAQGHVEATSWERKLPNLTVLPYNTQDEALTAVVTGTADAALIDAISGRLFLRSTFGLKRITPAVTVEPFSVVVRIENAQLLENIDTALTNLQNNGKLEEIIAHWLD
ncbi:MAG: amino acid ABC transporter substrate-binding protein [Anaerolineales bacterium]|nr:amino acid ABC transporter substrate-binding protein [Anaerolineales bacterium]